ECQTVSPGPPATQLTSHLPALAATRPKPARRSGAWDQDDNSPSRSDRYDSLQRKSSKPSQGSHKTARPTPPGFPGPGRRPPTVSAANHPNRVAPSYVREESPSLLYTIRRNALMSAVTRTVCASREE